MTASQIEQNTPASQKPSALLWSLWSSASHKLARYWYFNLSLYPSASLCYVLWFVLTAFTVYYVFEIQVLFLRAVVHVVECCVVWIHTSCLVNHVDAWIDSGVLVLQILLFRIFLCMFSCSCAWIFVTSRSGITGIPFLVSYMALTLNALITNEIEHF